MFRPLAVLSMLMAVGPLIASAVGAECVKVTPRTWTDMPSSELVFSGTVVEVTGTADLGYRAAFDVARVWKGSVHKRIDLYVWEMRVEVPRFVRGAEYVAVAKRLTDSRERQGVGLGATDELAFSPVQCSDMLSVSEFVRDLGPGSPPEK